MAQLQQPTLDRLKIETRLLLNQPDAKNSFWSDAEITNYLNDAVNMYFHEVAERSEGQFDIQVDLDITANQETVALPSDFFELKALYRKQSSGFYQILSYRNNLTESYQNTNAASGDSYAPSYYFRGTSLVLRQPPSQSETAALRMEYTALPETMIFGGNTAAAGISPTFKELLVTYAVWKCKIKESLVTGTNTFSPVEELLNAVYTRFKDAVGYRSKNPTFILPFNP